MLFYCYSCSLHGNHSMLTKKPYTPFYVSWQTKAERRAEKRVSPRNRSLQNDDQDRKTQRILRKIPDRSRRPHGQAIRPGRPHTRGGEDQAPQGDPGHEPGGAGPENRFRHQDAGKYRAGKSHPAAGHDDSPLTGLEHGYEFAFYPAGGEKELQRSSGQGPQERSPAHRPGQLSQLHPARRRPFRPQHGSFHRQAQPGKEQGRGALGS